MKGTIINGSKNPTPKAWCDALTALRPDRRRIKYREVEQVLPSVRSNYPISRDLARVIAQLILDLHLTRILEFGAGASSLVIATALKKLGGGALTSIESEPRYCRQQWTRINRSKSIDGLLVIARIARATIASKALNVYCGAESAIERRGPYDAVLIDGPRGDLGREGTLYQAWKSLADEAIVIVDDVGRKRDLDTVRAWMTYYHDLLPLILDPYFGGRGVAILLASKREKVGGRVRQPCRP